MYLKILAYEYNKLKRKNSYRFWKTLLNYQLFQKFKLLEYNKFNHLTKYF